MNSKEIGKRLIKLRGARMREEVAASLRISLSALTMYELGNRIPRDEIKIALANYYGTSVQSLFLMTKYT